MIEKEARGNDFTVEFQNNGEPKFQFLTQEAKEKIMGLSELMQLKLAISVASRQLNELGVVCVSSQLPKAQYFGKDIAHV